MALLLHSASNASNLVRILHLSCVTHEGKVITFATDSNGKIWYSVKQDGFEDSYLNTPEKDRIGWERWKELEFPNEPEDPSVINKEKLELTYEGDASNFIIRSLYKTEKLTAVAPVQAISTQEHVYVFRQSLNNTLLVDRFVLDAMTNRLKRKLEVRFKRSRQKFTPSKNMTKGSGGLSNVDTLDFRDTNNNFFYEPTTEICTISNLHNGWFSAVCVPTIENDIYRWHIFAYNNKSNKIELTTLRASGDGLFSVRDYNFFEESNESCGLRKISGIIRRTFDIPGVTITTGLTASKYDIQQEQETQSGEKQLLRMSTRLMLVIATDKGAVSVSFGIAKDGLLADVDQKTDNETGQTILRAQLREVLLPLTTLEEIKPLSERTPPPSGVINALARGTEDDGAEDLVKVATDTPLTDLADGDLVTIGGNDNYQGCYRTKVINENNFEVTLPQNIDNLGYWDKEEAEEHEKSLRFDGMISAYQRTQEGKLLICCENHGLQDGDEVQLIGTDCFNQTYPVQKIDEQNFVINKKWPQGEILNLKVLSVKRLGVVFDGVDDSIELPEMNFPFSKGISIEAWVWVDRIKPNTRIVDFSNGSETDCFALGCDKASDRLTLLVYSGSILQSLTAPNALETGKWMHLAATIDGMGHAKLYINGIEVKSGSMTPPTSIKRFKNYIGRSSTENEGFLQGKVSDLRLWNAARSAEEIKNCMYQQLTGHETSLVGYWRLTGITEGTVPDFGVYLNDGKVSGDPYVSATLLQRTLRDGEKASRYSNPELVAVSQRTTYEESFEFKVEASTPVTLAYLNNVDGRNHKIFTFSPWGKASRSAEGRIAINLAANAQTFQEIGKGWFRASCRFTIPEGVGMLRCFELANVKGDWTSLEIRKHRIFSVSESITEARVSQSLTNLKTLVDHQSTLADSLKSIDQKEQHLLSLARDKRELQDKITLLEMPMDEAILQKEREVARQQLEFNSALTILNNWREDNIGTRQRIIAYKCRSYIFQLESVGLGRHTLMYQFSSMVLGEGIKVILPDRTVTSNLPAYLNPSFGWHTYGEHQNPFFAASMPKPPQMTIEVQTKNYGYTDAKLVESKLAEAEQRKNLQESKLKSLQQELELIKSEDNKRKEELRLARLRLKQTEDLIKTLQDELDLLNINYMKGVHKNQATPQAMPQLAEDARGLITKGAVLGFVNPGGRIHSLETSEGNVQLSYFDTDGRVRLTNFDATSDSRNPAFEQWIPDVLRCCLYVAGQNSTIQLEKPINLSDQWSIEAWFTYPLPESPTWNTLIKGKKDSLVLVKGGKQIGFYHADGLLGKNFFPVDFDLQYLPAGWHHLAVVAREDTQIFFLNGKRVGDTKSKALADAETAQKANPTDVNLAKLVSNTKKCKIKSVDEVVNIGGDPNTSFGSNPFGRLAEVRLWGVALSDDEVAINSQTLLSGNEPGLMAYYPLNEGKGLIVQNHTGILNNGEIKNLVDVPSIQVSINKVMKFEADKKNSIQTAVRNLSGDEITIEYWFKGSRLQSAVRQQMGGSYIVSGWNGMHILSNDGATTSGIKVGNAATDGNWHHVALTWKKSTANGFVSYLDGNLIEQRQSSSQAIPAIDENVYIGSYIGRNEFINGCLAEVRVWKKARSQAQIQDTMNIRLSGNENDLLIYYPMNGESAVEDNSLPVSSTGSTQGASSRSTERTPNAQPQTQWIPCTAPIGSPIKKILRFNGTKDHIKLPDSNHDFSEGFTGECWLFLDRLNSNSRFFDLGKGSKSDNITIGNLDTTGKLKLEIFQGSSAQQVATTKEVLIIKKWIHVAATVDKAGKATLYVNGVEVESGQLRLPNKTNRNMNYIGRSNSAEDGYFQGKISEMRFWNKSRSKAEIKASMHRRLAGNEQNLIACYPLDRILIDASRQNVLNLVDNQPAQVVEALLIDSNTLPLAQESLISSEYCTVTVDPFNQSKVALMRRFLAYPIDSGAELLSEKRVEALSLRWIGNAQYAPTLLGFIEGPPPLPSENLTIEEEYSGATSVDLTMSEDTSFSWNRSQEVGLGAELSASLGGGSTMSILTAPAGIGTSIDLEVSAKANLSYDFTYAFTNETNITSSSSLSVTDKLELRGSPEETPHFPRLGNRFIPKNVGYALVVSALADVFITRLARSGKMIGYQVQPVDGIPPDVNTITFLMNPAYTMNGSLDGMTGSEPTSNRFFRHIREMRAQYGSLYPASYYRLKEAYNLKQAIESEDKRREAYFANFDVRTVDETSLDRNIESGAAPTVVGVQREEDKPNATADDQASAQNTQVAHASQQLQASADESSSEAKKKQEEIQSKIGDRERQVHASEAFASWQRRMEAIQIKAGKRNIVNTYVWDADGGLRTEQQSFASTIEHSIGGSFSMNGSMGFELEIEAFGINVGLNAAVNVSLTQTMTKTLETSRGFQLNVDLSGVESRGISNYKDLPLMPGEKVDRYRFMSFYLEGSTQNFADFFNYVVDPEWLASNDEEARALRQTQAGKPNKAWRILHRVTYVERPALMGFGRDIRPTGVESKDQTLSEIVVNLKELDCKQSLLEKKLDKILALLSQK